MKQGSKYRSTMKLYAAFVFFLALALVSESRIVDNSIVDFGKCTSRIHVEIRGKGEHYSVKQAREKCKTDCRMGAKAFNSFNCPRLCGIDVVNRPTNCYLCYNSPEQYIYACRSLIAVGVSVCEERCELYPMPPAQVWAVGEGNLRRNREKVPQQDHTLMLEQPSQTTLPGFLG